MAIVIIRSDDKIGEWKDALSKAAPHIPIYSFLEDHPKEDITMALVWKHPVGAIQGYPNLRCIAGSGAGVDFLFEDETAPLHLPITRVVDDMLAKDMSEHVLALFLAYLKNLYHYKVDQFNGVWRTIPYKRITDCRVGILGLGALGTVLAKDLVNLGCEVQGWSSSPKTIGGVQSFSGVKELPGFLAASQVLVCLLPLTKDTLGILNTPFFELLPKGAFVINVARGGHMVDQDLLDMLDAGHLSGAALDVYHEEPLPAQHPFWNHPKIHMTPHYASVSDTQSVVPQIVENYRRLRTGEPLLHLVSKDRGY
ncbi:MAG: glyoxylate/hydroxypyruvate reductase A [Bacteroidota bacterium]